MTAPVSGILDRGPENLAAAMVAERFAAADERRRVELERALRFEVCAVCGSRIHVLGPILGVCTQPCCRRAWWRLHPESRPPRKPPKRRDEPYTCCGSKGYRHRAGCPEAGKVSADRRARGAA